MGLKKQGKTTKKKKKKKLEIKTKRRNQNSKGSAVDLGKTHPKL